MNHRRPHLGLRERVINAAEAVLENSGAVGPFELLEQIGFLSDSHVRQWKRGNPYFESLEPHIQCGQEKLQKTYKIFMEWVQEKKLQPIEVTYSIAGRGGARPLQASTTGDPESELFFKTHFRRADLSEAKEKSLSKKLNKTPDIVVYQATGSSRACSECSQEIQAGDLMILEKQEPLCLTCADMDHLEFLPSGDAAMTRRSKKASPLSAVVVKFNRRHKRYERQGILVTTAAIDLAEQQCAADADRRASRRQVDALRREQADEVLVKEITSRILDEFPNCPLAEAERISDHTAKRGSGRVGRSAAGRGLELPAIVLAVRAHVRHEHTQYDELLMQGIERQEARAMIADELDTVIDRWR